MPNAAVLNTMIREQAHRIERQAREIEHLSRSLQSIEREATGETPNIKLIIAEARHALNFLKLSETR